MQLVLSPLSSIIIRNLVVMATAIQSSLSASDADIRQRCDRREFLYGAFISHFGGHH